MEIPLTPLIPPRPLPDWQAILACLPMPKALFITGTDTDVGKTWVTTRIAEAALALGLTVHVLKPVQTGVQPEDPGDVETVLTRLGPHERLSGKTLYRFAPPAAPWPADVEHCLKDDPLIAEIRAELQAHALTLNAITLIEGAGGLRVPITASLDMLGLIRALDVPTVLVARPNLGTINHTRLSCDAMQAAGIHCLGVIVNSCISGGCSDLASFAEATLPGVLDVYLPFPVLGYT